MTGQRQNLSRRLDMGSEEKNWESVLRMEWSIASISAGEEENWDWYIHIGFHHREVRAEIWACLNVRRKHLLGREGPHTQDRGEEFHSDPLQQHPSSLTAVHWLQSISLKHLSRLHLTLNYYSHWSNNTAIWHGIVRKITIKQEVNRDLELYKGFKV